MVRGRREPGKIQEAAPARAFFDPSRAMGDRVRRVRDDLRLSYRPPKAEPLAMRGEKVAAVVMMKNEIIRRQAEDVLAREITHYGAKGIAMYRLSELPPAGERGRQRARPSKPRHKGVVVMRPTGTKPEPRRTRIRIGRTLLLGLLGRLLRLRLGIAVRLRLRSRRARGGTGTVRRWAAPGGGTETVTTTEQVVEVEVMVYSLKQNALVWAGVSHTTEPTKVDEFVIRSRLRPSRSSAEQGLLSGRK
jgi:hypothetical protein